MMQNNQKIPEGWSVKKLGDIGKVSMCKRIMKHETNPNTGVPFYKIGTFGGKADAYISEALYIEYKNKYSYPKKGDILISAAGTIGRTVVFDGKDSYFQDSNIVWVANDEAKALNKYLLYYYTTSPWYTTTGGAISRLYNENISNAQILLPPLPEQEKIAGILGTWDEAIEKLSSLIEQKKLLKKGLMQKLLTGKTRLKGFTQPWKDYELSDLLDYEQPTKYLVNDILKYSKEKVPVLTANKAFILGSTDDTCGIYCKGNCIIFDDFTTDMKYVTFPFKVKSSAIKILTSKENVILKFVFEQMKRINYPLGGHKRYYLSEYQYITIQVPDTNEQQAIADVLSTADEEIDLLNKKLEALKEQKKGLMQQLLTGQTRVKVN